MAIPPIEPYPMPLEHELPTNTAQWRVDPRRAMLLVHDMQRYFLRPFPARCSPVVELITNVAALRGRCADVGAPVTYTAQPGGMTPQQRGLLQDFWGPGMQASPQDRLMPEPLAPRDGDTVFTKWRASAFFRTDLLDLLRRAGRDQLIICGVYAHVGVLMTANDAFANDIQAFVVGDAVADFTRDYHRMTLDYAAIRCAMTVSTATVLRAMASVPTSTVGAENAR